MKDLLLSPEIGTVTYSLEQLQSECQHAELICIFSKMDMKRNKSGEVPPTTVYLRLEDSEDTYDLKDQFGAEYGFYDGAVLIKTDVGLLKRKELFEKMCLFGNEEDTDFMRNAADQIYPKNSLMKIICVPVSFSGLDENGRAVWKIVVKA